MKKSQCGNCLRVFEITEKQTIYCSLECEQQHDLFSRKNDINIKYMITATKVHDKLSNGEVQLESKHKQHIRLILAHGFLNVRLYEDIGEGAYYDATTIHGRNVEITILESTNQMLWRELDPVKVHQWFVIDINQNSGRNKDTVSTTEQLTLAI